MTGSGTGRAPNCILGDMRLRPPIIGDLGLSMPAADGGRTPLTTEPGRCGGPPMADPGRVGGPPTAEPETEDGSGTRAARLVCEPRLLLALERGVGGTGYWTPIGMGAAAYAGVERPDLDSFFERSGGVVRESPEPSPDDMLDSESSSRRLMLAREYGSVALRLEPAEPELRLEGCSGMTGGGSALPGKPPGMTASERTEGVPP